MRTIKFRGYKSGAMRMWFFGDLVTSPHYNDYKTGQVSIITDDDCSLMSVEPDSVGQFTGLKDVNGVDIYEGDILDGYIEDERWYGVVGWDDDMPSFFIENLHEDDFCQLSQTVVDEGLSVVGNEYENPDVVCELRAKRDSEGV